MKIVFDQGTPVPLRQHLTGHSVTTVHELGWSSLSNGILLDAAEQAGYELLITTDQNLRYQQSLTHRNLSILVLLSTSWSPNQLTACRVVVVILLSVIRRVQIFEIEFHNPRQLNVNSHRRSCKNSSVTYDFRPLV